MNLFILIIVILSIVSKCSSICTPVYGREPCTFTPAPPGHVPNCARPGTTYCEHPSYYPGQVIQYLLEKWKFDHATLLMDESKDDFNTYYVQAPDTKYSTNSVYGPPGAIQPDSYFPEPIHIPRPARPAFYPERPKYGPPPQHQRNFTQPATTTTTTTFEGYPERRKPFPPFFEPYRAGHLASYKAKNPFLAHDAAAQRFAPSVYKFFGQHHQQQFNPNVWWKREAQDGAYQAQLRRRRSIEVINIKKKLTNVEYGFNGTNSILSRKKRQNALTAQQLCDTTSQFIMPRAALNNKGDWKYVVNMPELDNRYTQLVKSETCASQQCNGICSLPDGYFSRCEQKYVQKRLIALETAGNQLYTDVFWFPSCCQCTITQN